MSVALSVRLRKTKVTVLPYWLKCLNDSVYKKYSNMTVSDHCCDLLYVNRNLLRMSTLEFMSVHPSYWNVDTAVAVIIHSTLRSQEAHCHIPFSWSAWIHSPSHSSLHSYDDSFMIEVLIPFEAILLEAGTNWNVHVSCKSKRLRSWGTTYVIFLSGHQICVTRNFLNWGNILFK